MTEIRKELKRLTPYGMGAEETKAIFGKKAVLSAIAYWAVNQSPYHRPDNLEVALDKVNDRLNSPDFSKYFPSENINFAEMDYRQIREFIESLCEGIPEIREWNLSKVEKEEGIKVDDPDRNFIFTSRYDQPEADYDIVDLGALYHNIANLITTEGMVENL